MATVPKKAEKKTPAEKKEARKELERLVPRGMTFKVEADVDLPEDTGSASAVYPWHMLKEHGQSFAVPGPTDKLEDIKRSLQQSARLWLKRAHPDGEAGFRFVVKLDPKNASGAVRVWRKDDTASKDAEA